MTTLIYKGYIASMLYTPVSLDLNGVAIKTFDYPGTKDTAQYKPGDIVTAIFRSANIMVINPCVFPEYPEETVIVKTTEYTASIVINAATDTVSWFPATNEKTVHKVVEVQKYSLSTEWEESEWSRVVKIANAGESAIPGCEYTLHGVSLIDNDVRWIKN